MAITQKALEYICECLVSNNVPSPFNYIGLGNGTQPFQEGDLDLRGTQKLRKKMDVGFPRRSQLHDYAIDGKITLYPNEANFEWNEWGIFNASTGGIMLNRKVAGMGTKTSSGTWTMRTTLVFEIDKE